MRKSLGKEQVEELTVRWKRALADYQNLEKRYEREKADFVAFAGSNLILKLLVVLDHLKMAQAVISDPGLDIAIKEFGQVLNEEGLIEVEALDKKFDPSLMEAVDLVKGEKDKVIEVLQTGYSLKGKLLRAARVRVGKG